MCHHCSRLQAHNHNRSVNHQVLTFRLSFIGKRERERERERERGNQRMSSTTPEDRNDVIPEDLENVPVDPSPQISTDDGKPRNRLSKTSLAFDRGNKGWLDEAERLGRKYDKNNDGKIDRSEMFNIIEDVITAQKQQHKLKKYLIIAFATIVLLAVAMFGMTYAVVALTKELQVSSDGDVVSTKTGEQVNTVAKGASVEMTPTEDVRRKLQAARRQLRNDDYDLEDRFLEAGEQVGSVYKSEAAVAWATTRNGGTVQVTLTNPDTGVVGTLSLSSDAVRTTLPGGIIEYTQVARAAYPGIFYTVICEPSKSTCPVTSDSRRRLQIGCFSPDMTVVTKTRGKVKAKDLLVGIDQVLTEPGGKAFETVFIDMHQHPTKRTPFLKIYTQSGSAIELTETHLIFVYGKKYPVPASAIRVGDNLIDGSLGEATTVTKIATVMRSGFYAPHTPSGKIVVDGLLASTYTAALPSFETEYFTLGGIQWISHQQMGDFSYACCQVHCRFLAPGSCVGNNVKRNDDGMFYMVVAVERMVRHFSNPNPLIKFIMFITFIPCHTSAGLVSKIILWFADHCYCYAWKGTIWCLVLAIMLLRQNRKKSSNSPKELKLKKL